MIGIGKNLFKGNVKVGGAVAYDADALAYFTANTAITNTADKNAINTFYLGLKSDGIYTKLKAMYLWKWGSASADKWNMVNPLDTDAAFRCTFAVGFTYSTSGITGNGTSSYIQNYFNPNTILTLNNASFGLYSNTDRVGSNSIFALGCNDITGNFSTQLRRTDNSAHYFVNDTTGTAALFFVTNTKGFFQASRINGTQKTVGYNNTFTTYSHLSTAKPNLNMYFFARNNTGTVGGYESIRSPFGYVGNGLTTTEMTNFNTRVNTLMTYFGINV